MSVRAVIEKLGATWVAPPVLQPAAVYLELSGEDLRRRAFLVSDELCLRPDMTAPAVRAAFAMAQLPAIVAYEGLVFRQQAAGSLRESEFVQIGAEWLGRGAFSVEDEAAVIAVALEACAAAGVAPRLTLGDVGLRAAFVAACGLEETWAARTMAALEHPERLDALKPPTMEAEGAGLAEALASLAPDHAEAAVADLLSLAQITAVGGRPITEIAERLRQRGRMETAPPPSDAQRAVLRELVAINAADGLAQAEKLAGSPALKNGAVAKQAVAQARARQEALAKRIALPADARFAPGLGRAISYYDGFVFELEAPQLADRASLGGGGRYDGLARALWPAEKGDGAGLRAAGFAVRPARLAEAAR